MASALAPAGPLHEVAVRHPTKRLARVEPIDSTASEPNLDLAHLVSNAVTEACREANLSIIGSEGDAPEELVRSAVEAALRTEMATQARTRHDGRESPDWVGEASRSGVHDAEVALFANRSVAEVLELVRFAAEEAVQSELASQAETRPGGGTPVSVGGGSHSVAHDAEVALLAYRSVQEVLSVVAERPEPERPPQRPVERPARPPPERPERPARREPERPEQPVAPVRPAGQDQDRTIIDAPTSATISQRNVRPVIQRSGSVLVDPNLTAQLCSLLNAPETPPGEDARMCREPLPRRARNPETPPGEEARMRREPLPRKARDEPGLPQAAEPYRNVRPVPVIQRSGSVLVDPDLIAQLCSLLNAPETPPGEEARMRREPLPRKARDEPGLPQAAEPYSPSQPSTARTSVRSRGSASDKTSGESDVNEALEEEVFNIMDMLCMQIEEPQAA
ncbi:unnamed protein product [Durusdinium trenchii]|uniref:Uncharacterized protein n=1 Tax=Durusdinium trenchii TaxID=1381693 RepID=A0ABP0LCG9_9DINO